MSPPPSQAYRSLADHRFAATELTRGPWDPAHQHAGPPTALVCRAIEAAAAMHGLSHVGRMTVNLLRPVPIADLHIELREDYIGRNAGHFSASLWGQGKELARITALVQRELVLPVPAGTPGHPLPSAPKAPADCEHVDLPFKSRQLGYADLVENRLVEGRFFAGPCTAWFHLNHALVDDETPSPYQRVAVAADSGNGISAALDFKSYLFVNSDLTINLLRRPLGEWICLAARTELGGNGCGLAESALYDETGLIGRATQSLAVRPRV